MRTSSGAFIEIDKAADRPGQEWLVSLQGYQNQPRDNAIVVQSDLIKKRLDLSFYIYSFPVFRRSLRREQEGVLPQGQEVCCGGKAAGRRLFGFLKMLPLQKSRKSERIIIICSKPLDKSPLTVGSDRCGVGTVRIIPETSQTIRGTDPVNKGCQSSEAQDAILPFLGKNCTAHAPIGLPFALDARDLGTPLGGKRTVSELGQMDLGRLSRTAKHQKQSTRKYRKYWHLPVTSNRGIEEE